MFIKVTEYNNEPKDRLSSGPIIPLKSESTSSVLTGTASNNSELAELVSKIRQPNSGLEIKDRKRKLSRTLRRCFVGKELVDWILTNVELTTYNRSAAKELGQQLLNRGFVQSVSNSKVFEDGNQFYRFSDDQNLVNIRKASTVAKKNQISPSHKTNSFNSYSSLVAPIPGSLHQSLEYPVSRTPILFEKPYFV